MKCYLIEFNPSILPPIYSSSDRVSSEQHRLHFTNANFNQALVHAGHAWEQSEASAVNPRLDALQTWRAPSPCTRYVIKPSDTNLRRRFCVNVKVEARLRHPP